MSIGDGERGLARDIQWPALGALAAFVIAGALTREPGNLALSLIGGALALGAAALLPRSSGLAAQLPRSRGWAPLLPSSGRWAPLLVAIVAGAGVALVAGGHPSDIGWFGLCLLAFWCVLAAGPACGAAFTLACVALLVADWLSGSGDVGWAPWIPGVLVSAAAAALAVHERSLVTQLRAAQAGLAERSRVEERNRIARELHDVIAHSLTVSLLHVESARLAVEHEPDDAARTLAEAARLGRESLDEVRSIVGLLRTDADRPSTAPVPGIDGFGSLVGRFRSAGIDVTLTLDGDFAPVRATAGATLYRILQEALTNAAKHAPGSPVQARVAGDGGRVVLTVDSAGEPGGGSGLGLIAMRERAQAVGGSCEAGPGGAGWLVRASIPVAPTGAAAARPR